MPLQQVRRFGIHAKVQRDPDAQAPAGGISSNIRDLAQWVRLEIGNGMYDGKRLIAAAALAETHVPLTARGNNPVAGGASFYGLGWNVEYGRHGLVWGHAGAFSAGAQTLVSIYPKAKLGIVLLTNAFPSGVPEGLADSFADLVFDGMVGRNWLKDWGGVYQNMFAPSVTSSQAAYAAPPAGATASLALSAYSGGYANPYVGHVVVAEANGTLTLTGKPDFEDNAMSHNVIRQLDDAENAPQFGWLDKIAESAKIVFQTSSHEAAVSMALEGGGLACLARFRADRESGLVQLDPPIRPPTTGIWLAVHFDNRDVARIRAVMNHVIDRVRAMQDLLMPEGSIEPLAGSDGS